MEFVIWLVGCVLFDYGCLFVVLVVNGVYWLVLIVMFVVVVDEICRL